MIPYFTIEILAKHSLKMMLDRKGLIYIDFSILLNINFFELISTQCTFLLVYCICYNITFRIKHKLLEKENLYRLFSTL